MGVRERRPVAGMVMVAAIALAGCGEGDVTQQPGWTRLPDPPLGGRTAPVAVSVDYEVLVFGGSQWTCPPGADCVGPAHEPLVDGAAYDVRSGRWRPIADAPVGIVHAAVVTLAGNVYALRRCEVGPGCATGPVLLRYRTAEDRWDLLAAPPGKEQQHLVAVGEHLVALGASDEQGEVTDYVFDPPSDTWTALPDDPLPASYGRMALDVDGRLFLFATGLDPEPQSTEVAVLDLNSGVWARLPGSKTQGYQAWRSGDLVYLNPHFAPGGGLFDPAAAAWSPLPDPPEAQPDLVDLAGVVGHGSATYEYAGGWVLDTEDGKWIQIPTRPGGDEVFDESVTSVGEALFVVGGQRWSSGEGELLAEAWTWAAG